MEESFDERKVKLVLDHKLLISWAEEAGLMGQSPQDTIDDSLRAFGLDIAAILSAIRTALEDIGRLKGRYEELRNSHVGQDMQAGFDSELVKQPFSEAPAMLSIPDEKHDGSSAPVRKIFSSLKTTIKHPKRLRWVFMDENKFDEALKRLHYYTTRLRSFMGDSRLKAIQSRTEAIFMEVVQVMVSQKELADLVQGVLHLLTESHVDDMQPKLVARHELEILRDLATLKEMNVAEIKGNLISTGQIKFHSNDGEAIITTATYQKITETGEANQEFSGAKPQTVWIEWKGYGPADSKLDRESSTAQSEAMRSNMENRTSQLAKLLSCPKPIDFCTPTCLGYFEEPDNHRFGWVFAAPPYAASQPKSLRSLFSTSTRPSLTERTALASRLSACLLYLHAVDWLHKGFCSDNILFFFDGDSISLSDPIVSGFELSRPDNSNAKTLENTPANTSRDLYRWPSSQTHYQDEHSWRKTFDIYSLGIVLIEIAHWQPIEKVMGIVDVTPSQCQKIQPRIIQTEPEHLAKILETVGRKYHDAVKTCIQGYKGFDLEENDNQSAPDIALPLQRKYRERVVHQLKGINV